MEQHQPASGEVSRLRFVEAIDSVASFNASSSAAAWEPKAYLIQTDIQVQQSKD